MTSKEKAQEILSKAGITINGESSIDMQVHDERLYDRAFSSGSLGIGEAYMDGWWDVENLPGFFAAIFKADLHKNIQFLGAFFYVLRANLTNMQSKSRAFEVGERHYDIGNDLYQHMLGKTLAYSCGYWSGTPSASTLDEAQEAKLDLICRKLSLKRGQHVLDVGCGWGSFMKFAAENYGVRVSGVTVSKEQAALTRERLRDLPIDIEVKDYREITGTFDHIVSVGMFEHVGPKNYRPYMEKMYSLLKDDGLFLLHTIGYNISSSSVDPWIHKYIFPNGTLPSAARISSAIEDIFVLEDWHSFGADYDKTLMSWAHNFEQAWPQLRDTYGERFYRMWRYYLLSCAGGFRARKNQLWQLTLSKKGVASGYRSVR